MKSMYPIQNVFLFFGFVGGNLLSTLPPPHKNAKNNGIGQVTNTLPKPNEIHIPNSDSISVFTFRGTFPKYPGPPLQKWTNIFHKQTSENTSKTLWTPCTQFRLDLVFLLFRGNLLSTLGPPCTNAKNNFITNILKTRPKPHEIHVPNSDCFFVRSFWGLQSGGLQNPSTVFLGQENHSLDWGPTVWGPTVWGSTVWGPSVSIYRFWARRATHLFARTNIEDSLTWTLFRDIS